MAYGDEFDSLMKSAFTVDELSVFDRQESQQHILKLEPVEPDREGILTHYDDILDVIVSLPENKITPELLEQFILGLLITTDFKYGETIKIGKVASFMSEDESGDRDWTALTCDTDLFGEFAGFGIGHWYDVPVHEFTEDESIYLRKFGLFISATNPKMVSDGETIEGIGDIVHVPLQHGVPELFRILED